MLIFKYGILIQSHQNQEPSTREWRIALFSGSVDEHTCIDVEESVFDHRPSLGDSVKIGYNTPNSRHPSVVKKCTNWIRDVTVINQTVVIFGIVHFSRGNMLHTFRQTENSDVPYYIMDNSDTDCRKVAIPRELVDFELRNRSKKQKSDEPLIYRVGICYDPVDFLNGPRVEWRYYSDSSMVPIFELYSRDTMLPFLAESMVYGALEAVVIARNKDGALFWSPRMGCATFSSVTSADVPQLGSVRLINVKRCLADSSFGFPVFYELLPIVLEHVWQKIRVITDITHDCIYIETSAECVRRVEQNSDVNCMDVPHIGKIDRGLAPHAGKLVSGEKYFFRLNFEKVENSFQPVIVDLQLKDDFTVSCRVVYVSKKMQKYFLVLDSNQPEFRTHCRKVDFVSLPFHTLFCTHQTQVEPDQMLSQKLAVRIRQQNSLHGTAEAVHVAAISHDQNYQGFKLIQGRVWFFGRAVYQGINEESFEFIADHHNQIVTDFNRVAERVLVRSTYLAFQAQFALTPRNKPMFLLRHAALSPEGLPALTPNVISNLPTLRTVFHRIFVQMQQERIFRERNGGEPPLLEISNDRNSVASNSVADISSDTLNRDIEGSVSSRVPTIVEDSSYPLSNHGIESDGDETIVGTIASSRGGHFEGNNGHPFPDNVSYASSEAGSIMQESWLSSASSVTSSYVSSSSYQTDRLSTSGASTATLVERPTLFGYNEPQGERRLAGFGSSRHSSESSRSLRSKGRLPKYGFRKFQPGRYTSYEVLDIMIHRHMQFREMFVECTRDALHSWTRRPTGKVVSTKMRSCNCFPVEMTDFTEAHGTGRFPFTHLVRFICTTDLNIQDMSVVVPFGGNFPSLQKGFQLGTQHSCRLYTFLNDRMVRFSGHAKHIGDFGVTECSGNEAKQLEQAETVDDNRGHFWVRFRARAARPQKQILANDVFELWSPTTTIGLIVVEKTPDLMKHLRPFDTDILHDDYSVTIEPLAGGPIDIANLLDEEDENSQWHGEGCVFWRAVVEFSDSVELPELVQRHRPHVEEPKEAPPGWVPPKDTPIAEYGLWKTMEHNLRLAQKRADKLRALNDPRVYWVDGPAIRKDIANREVDITTRREKMLTTLDVLYKNMPTLKEKGFFPNLVEDEFMTLIKSCLSWDDEHHLHCVRKRNQALTRSCNYMTNLLCHEKTYQAMMQSDGETLAILKLMSDCLGMNNSYIRKTEEAKRMLLFMYRNKLHSYI